MFRTLPMVRHVSIDIRGIDKAELLTALYNGAISYSGDDLTVEQARKFLARTENNLKNI